MMNPDRLFAFGCLAAPFLLLSSGAASAQDTGEDEVLEEISLPERFQVQDEDIPEESYEDLVFDTDTGSYRLIEDDSGDDWVEEPNDRASAADELQRLFDLYREALNAGQYLEADTLAKQVVEFSIRINGLDSFDSAKAIANLGIAQHHNADYESALRNFQASIDIIERNKVAKLFANAFQRHATLWCCIHTYSRTHRRPPPLTAPIVSPLTICFCPAIPIITTGSIAISAAADSFAHKVCSTDTKLYIATVTGRTVLPPSCTANRNHLWLEVYFAGNLRFGLSVATKDSNPVWFTVPNQHIPACHYWVDYQVAATVVVIIVWVRDK